MKKALCIVLLASIGLLATACAQDEPDAADATTEPSATEASRTDEPGEGSSASDLAALAADTEACGYTPESTAGPYYVSGTRELTGGDLNYDDLDGTPMKIGGYVYGADDNSDPIADARIEIWQADDDGAYHPQSQGPASSFDGNEISLRGYVMSDDDGYYEFTSILPGEYEGRVRHIHVRAEAEGHQTLISQIIVAQDGDRIQPENDMVSGNLPDCSIAEFTESDGVQTAVFNFHIQGA